MIIYIDMDDVLCDFSGAHRKALVDNPKLLFPQSQYGFFTNLPEKEGAVESVNAFVNSPKYDPYILTAPSIRNPLSYTEKRVWNCHSAPHFRIGIVY
jgi:5'-nucleotidase